MTQFDEFRVVLQPDLAVHGNWTVLLEDCNIPALEGPKGTIQVLVTRPQLTQLRSRNGWPNPQTLHTIGQTVWQTLMTPSLEAAFQASLQSARTAQRGMRFVVALVGDENAPADQNPILCRELPLEALYEHRLSFVATSLYTPISRSLRYTADRDPYPLQLPLRILCVVAAPHDKPPAQIPQEQAVVAAALQKLIAAGAVELEYCQPPTNPELQAQLQKGFHVLHFIGHGSFDIVGEDPYPQPHICLVDPVSGASDPLDAETLHDMLKDSTVRLAVFTACSSAAPTPKEVETNVGPFHGVAQRLVSNVSGVSAVVAMQFDLEDQAAVTFSEKLYSNLLVPGRPLDEIIVMCRKAIVAQLSMGHRAWVTPVVYWRCQDGKVFEVEATKRKRKLDQCTRDQLIAIDVELRIRREHIAELHAYPRELQPYCLPKIAEEQQKVDDLLQGRGQLLGEALRLIGGPAQPGVPVACRLTMRLQTPGQVGSVRVTVRYPADKVDYVGKTAGTHAASMAEVVDPVSGQFMLRVPTASQCIQWDPQEYELAVLRFQLRPGVTDPIIDVDLDDPQVQKNGANAAFETVSAVLFVTALEEGEKDDEGRADSC